MSRLRRDRKALRWGRYARRADLLVGQGNARGTWGEFSALAWLLRRQSARGFKVDDVMRRFYGA